MQTTTCDSCQRERRAQEDRRLHSLRTLTYCFAQPGRRRTARRAGDNYYLDWYDPRLVFAGVGIMLLSTADASLTLMLMSHGANEVNALMAQMMEISIPLFAVVKMAITGAGVLFLLTHAHFHILKLTTGRQAIYAVLGIYTMLISYELFLLARYA
jgi:hypothetical protein